MSKYRIDFTVSYQLSECVFLELPVVKEQIVAELLKEEYRIVEETDFTIVFEDCTLGLFRLRGAGAFKLNKGIFTIKELNGTTTIELLYFIAYWQPAIIILGSLLMTFLTDFFVLLAIPFVLIAFGIEILNQKSNSRSLMKTIVSKEPKFTEREKDEKLKSWF